MIQQMREVFYYVPVCSCLLPFHKQLIGKIPSFFRSFTFNHRIVFEECTHVNYLASIIHSGDKHNAEIRKALQSYLLQFVHSASIESASNLNLQLKIGDAVLLNLNGESCSGRNATPWQTNAATTDRNL